jgi:hypothetical protein
MIHRRQGHRVATMALLHLACGARVGSTSTTTGAGSNVGAESPPCAAGAPLAGASYDLAKSRFAFGSSPVEEDSLVLKHFVGKDGVVAIWPSGGEMGSMNGGAPETSTPDWSTDVSTLQQHVVDYFGSMGVQSCQIDGTGVNGGVSGGGAAGGPVTTTNEQRSISLTRAIDGIVVVESLAHARFDADDQTTSEGLYWPEIPADVVTAAEALRSELASPDGLAAFKAKLPGAAQGEGRVVIHHTSFAPAVATTPFHAAATYDVTYDGPDTAEMLSFDATGAPVPLDW